jgi:hypothetical protein
MEVVGVEIVSNDLSTVFPAVRLRWPGVLPGTRGEVLAEATAVAPSEGGGHRFTVALPRTIFTEAADIFVEVALPPRDCLEAIGAGAGLGALDLAGAQATSYIGNESTSEIQAIDADLCVALVAGTVAGKVGRGSPDAGTPQPRDLELSVSTRVGGDVEVLLVTPHPVVVAVDLYDVRGKLVRALSRGELPPGEHHLAWDRRDAAGRVVAAGVYFVVAHATGFRVTRKAVLLR